MKQVRSSIAMEKEGLRCCLDKLFDQGVDIILVATDRHTDVASLMKKCTLTLNINMMSDCVTCMAKSITKIAKKAKANIVVSSSHGFSPFLTAYCGLHKVVKVMHNF